MNLLKKGKSKKQVLAVCAATVACAAAALALTGKVAAKKIQDIPEVAERNGLTHIESVFRRQNGEGYVLLTRVFRCPNPKGPGQAYNLSDEEISYLLIDLQRNIPQVALEVGGQRVESDPEQVDVHYNWVADQFFAYYTVPVGQIGEAESAYLTLNDSGQKERPVIDLSDQPEAVQTVQLEGGRSVEIRVQSASADGRNLLVECLSDGETQMVYPALADLGMAGTNWRAQETVESMLEQSEERSLSLYTLKRVPSLYELFYRTPKVWYMTFDNLAETVYATAGEAVSIPNPAEGETIELNTPFTVGGQRYRLSAVKRSNGTVFTTVETYGETSSIIALKANVGPAGKWAEYQQPAITYELRGEAAKGTSSQQLEVLASQPEGIALEFMPYEARIKWGWPGIVLPPEK